MSSPRIARGHRVSLELDVECPMRDGTILRADIYRPDGVGPFPTLLSRIPYGKGSVSIGVWSGFSPVEAARSGFLVILQDVRGTGSSDGEWRPFRHECDDGFDSVEWAARLPDSNGRVGMFGMSYFALTQLAAAIANPPSLKAIAPNMISADADDFMFRDGVRELGLDTIWSVDMAAAHAVRRNTGDDADAARRARIAEMADQLRDFGTPVTPGRSPLWLAPQEIDDWLREFGATAEYRDFDEVVGSRGRSELDRILAELGRLELPMLVLGGWYDNFIRGTVGLWRTAVENGQEAHLIVGPWSHGKYEDPIGELQFGAEAARGTAEVSSHGTWQETHHEWFRRHLTEPSSPAQPFDSHPVRLFQMGRNTWLSAADLPAVPHLVSPWYLVSSSLTPVPPREESDSTRLHADLTSPVPTLGGNQVIPGYVRSPGGFEQGSVERRADVAIFTSEPLEADLDVMGGVSVRLWVVSSADTTDWVTKLCVVHPDGSSYNITQGVARSVSTAGTAQQLDVSLDPTCFTFLQGNRIRLQVANSDFPRWERAPGPWGPVEVRVLHDGDHPSRLELPVAPV